MSNIFLQQLGDCFLSTVISTQGNTITVRPWPDWEEIDLTGVTPIENCVVGARVKVFHEDNQWKAFCMEDCIPVTRIERRFPMSVEAGSMIQLSALVQPNNATYQVIDWYSERGVTNGNLYTAPSDPGSDTIRAVILAGTCGRSFARNFTIAVNEQ